MNIDQSAMCYISMDLSRQALKTNGMFFFSNFKFFFELLTENRKIFKTNNEEWILMKVQFVIIMSMDSFRQALQTNGKLFLKFRNNFLIKYTF